jgi:excisionase family DNA binding protein
LQRYFHIFGSTPAPGAILFSRPGSAAAQGRKPAGAGDQPAALQFSAGANEVSNTTPHTQRGKSSGRDGLEEVPRIAQANAAAFSRTADELLTPPDVCRLLKVSESTFFRLVRRAAFPVVHIGKLLRVRLSAVEAYIRKMEA